ncbi:MAG: HAMP domain-containing histidine kinase [Oscillospiraceae bacterium]|nr:HAMP domain-containing histidine kinase [Oscillospiraceae bacterium]
MKRSAREIGEQLCEKLRSDTNTLIDVSSADRDMRALAALLNSELTTLRAEQRRYIQGDKELKEAITNISHDLRTPLTAICGYLDLLEKCAQSDEIRQYLAQIENRTEAMRALTEELFRYSVAASESELTLEMLCVNDVLEECLASYYGAISERGITPEIDIAEERVSLIADRSALMRIFSNLISNALKYSQGDLCVSMKLTAADEGSSKRQCRIVFANSAENIRNIVVNRLFDRFYTVEDGNTSTGLGLSIAKLLTEKLSGEIAADIAEDKLEVRIDFTV